MGRARLLYILVCCLTGSYRPNKDDDYRGGDVTWVLFLSSTIYGLRWLFTLLALLEGFSFGTPFFVTFDKTNLFKIPVTHQVTASALIPAKANVARL